MTKVVKSGDIISLDKNKQKKVAKQTKKLKKKIQDGKIPIKRLRKSPNIEKRGLIYIGHIPHGFYEKEMKAYFKQFGVVTNAKICRSSKSGKSKGYGYVEFVHQDVAKIAAETMNNYLMFKKKIVAEYVSPEKRPKCIFKGRSSTARTYSSKKRREKQIAANLNIDETTHLKRSSARLSRLNKRLNKLKNVGIDYDFKPVDVPEEIKKKEAPVEEVGYTLVEDPFDSDIEVKVRKTPKPTPKKSSKLTPKKTPQTLKKTPQTPKKTPKKKSSGKS